MKKHLIAIALTTTIIATNSFTIPGCSFAKKTATQIKFNPAKYTHKNYKDHPLYHEKYAPQYYTQAWDRQKQITIKLLEEEGIPAINKTDYPSSGYTPLCHAIAGNDFDFVTFLLAHGANPNQQIEGVHSSRPIFFAKTLEMVQFLQDNGADIYEENEGQGVTGGMNFLHAAIHCNTQDDRLIAHALKLNINPQHLDASGGNLWHSLIAISARYCPEATLMTRAQLLKDLEINPHHQDDRGKRATDIIRKQVKEEDIFLSTQDKTNEHIADRIETRNKLERFLNVMEQTAQELKEQTSRE